MEEKKDEGLIFSLVKLFLVTFPMFLADGVHTFVQHRTDLKIRLAIYVLIVPLVIMLLFLLKILAGRLIP